MKFFIALLVGISVFLSFEVEGQIIDRLDSLINETEDPELIAELEYKKTYFLYKNGQYRDAYSSGLACTEEYKSKGLLIAAQSVAALANTCGNSTFDRKCNYLYAAELAEQAGQTEKATSYRAKGPSIDCASGLIPVTLDCWGVTVDVCR